MNYKFNSIYELTFKQLFLHDSVFLHGAKISNYALKSIRNVKLLYLINVIDTELIKLKIDK